MTASETKTKILELASELCQLRGFNAFSYHDLARELGIKTASIHYHYSTKADLGKALIENYRAAFTKVLEGLSSKNKTCNRRLASLIDQMSSIESEQRLCLCAMLTSDFETLPEVMRAEIGQFFLELEKWVANCLEQGRNNKEFSFKGTALMQAQAFVATLHGMLLSSRATSDGKRLKRMKSWMLASLVN